MTTDAPIIIRRSTVPETETDFPFDEMAISKSGHESLDKARLEAWKTYKLLPMPTSSDEAWRRTNLNGFRRSNYKLNGHSPEKDTLPIELTQPLAGDEQDGQVFIQPGKSTSSLKEEYRQKGVIFAPLQQAITENPDLAAKLGSIIHPTDGKFAALSFALARDGVVLYVPKNIKISNPLHSILWAHGSQIALFSHLLIWLEEDAEVTYIHEYASGSDVKEDIFHNGLVEIHAGKGSRLKFVELQSWGDGVWNVTHERVQACRDAQVEWIFGAVGSKLTKNFSDFNLIEDGASIKVSGFYFANGKQHFDHDTQQNHLAPNTSSDLLYKGAMIDQAYSVWQGMIYVAPGAQKTDGYQANRNLLLSKTARADSIPGLEIKADDVRCTHGATVGKIDPEQEFYLQSRGIPPQEAKKLIVEGFFESVMDRIPFEGVKNRLKDAIQLKMNTISI